MPLIPPPPMPPAWPFGSGFSAIMASVVMSSAATEAASCSAVRTTLAGSIRRTCTCRRQSNFIPI
jgi:hypothetical protein